MRMPAMTSEFKTPLEVRLLPEGGKAIWMLITPLVYFSNVLQRNLEVPEGFVTDFVSFEPLKGVGIRSAVIHDFMYKTKCVSKSKADKVFLEELEATGVPELMAHAMFTAVKLFGKTHYGRY